MAETRTVAIDQIIIPANRQRQKAEADTTLIESMRSHGLLNAIVIHDNNVLVAGERRLDAARKLGWAEIRCYVFEQLPLIQQHEIELMENLARKQLTWQEEVRAIGSYHAMRKDAFPGWTAMGTATALSLSEASISINLSIYEELADEEVLACPTRQGAYNLIKGRAERAMIAAQARGLSVAGVVNKLLPRIDPNQSKEDRTASLLKTLTPGALKGNTLDEVQANVDQLAAGKLAAAALKAEAAKEQSDDIILNADFVVWAESYSGPKFDVAHVDFPYGKGYSGSRTRRTGKAHVNPVYADDPDVYRQLVEDFLALQDNFLFPVAHCLFWFDMSYYQWTVDMFTTAGWSLVQPFPFIWTKPAQGVAADVKRRPRHCYETALIFSRGDRKISKLIVDHYLCPVDEKLHLSQKPIEMLEHFLSLVVDEHTAILDPTCGSGSALVAASKLKAARVLGLELEEANVEVARFFLQRHLFAKQQQEA